MRESTPRDHHEGTGLAPDTGQPTDADLLRAAAGGDQRAFETLVTRHAGVVLGLARRLLGRHADAEDLAQDVFLKVHRALGSFRGQASVRTWICQVAVNAARNRRRDDSRRARRLRLVSLADDAPPGSLRPEERAADERPDPERLALSAEARGRIEDALAELPEEFREALVLRDIEGLSYEDIALATGAQLGTVKSRIARARLRLQDLLGDLAGGASR